MVVQGVDRGIRYKEVIEISDIYSGMMCAYINSTIITYDPYIHLEPNPQPSDPPPQTGNFDLDAWLDTSETN